MATGTPDTTFFPSQFSGALAAGAVPAYITDPKAASEFARLEKTVDAGANASAGFLQLSPTDQQEFNVLRDTGTLNEDASWVSGLASGAFDQAESFGDLEHLYDSAGIPYGGGSTASGAPTATADDLMGVGPTLSTRTSRFGVDPNTLTPSDTNPSTQPIFRPTPSGVNGWAHILPVETGDGSDGADGGPAGGSGGPPPGSGTGSGTTTGSGSSSGSGTSTSATDNNSLISDLLGLMASQYASGASGGTGGGLLAAPVDLPPADATTATTASSGGLGLALLAVGVGLAIYFYMKHKRSQAA